MRISWGLLLVSLLCATLISYWLASQYDLLPIRLQSALTNSKSEQAGSVPSTTDEKAGITCFIANHDCEQGLEEVFIKDQFIGLGVKLDQNSTLLSPLAGQLTVGNVHFSPQAGGYRYQTLTLKKEKEAKAELTYTFAQDQEIDYRWVSRGESLLELAPLNNPVMPPYGNYDLVIRAKDDQGEVVDPKIYLDKS